MSSEFEKTEPTGKEPSSSIEVHKPSVPERITQVVGLTPRSFEEAWRFSLMISQSELAPPDYVGKPANVLVAIQMGAEVGLAPMASIQNIAVINGRPSLWGDGALAVVQSQRDYEFHKEYFEGAGAELVAICEIKRKGHDLHISRFSMRDAQVAGLTGKKGPWATYPERMLKMRARGFALRDKFSDALRGLGIVEETQDMPPANTGGGIEEPPSELAGDSRLAAKTDDRLNAAMARARTPIAPVAPVGTFAEVAPVKTQSELEAEVARAQEHLQAARRAAGIATPETMPSIGEALPKSQPPMVVAPETATDNEPQPPQAELLPPTGKGKGEKPKGVPLSFK